MTLRNKCQLSIPLMFLLAAALLLPAGAAAQDDQAKQDTKSTVVEGQVAPRLQNLGGHSHPITTDSARAQLFFNQGLILAYGFNHREARRSFQEAARLDPDCAMCYWGQALVLGPNINAPMDPENEAVAHELVQKALSLAGDASEKEQAYIQALAKRYSGEKEPGRAALDRAYAKAMGEVHKQYPEDLDAATLYAEALMDLRPWNYWTPDGKPYEETETIVPVLESVLKKDPRHPGATHLYIHAMEAVKPELAEAAADNLRDRVPGAGHLQHMPSHIYVRVGRFHDAAAVNRKAIQADEDYIAQCRAQGIYPLTYYPHNIHFLWNASQWQGRSQDAIEAARKVDAKTREHLEDLPEWGQIFPVSLPYTLVRFGKWDEILELPEPPGKWTYWRGVWHYARGMALARKGKLDKASKELKQVEAMAADDSLEVKLIGGNSTVHLLRVAAKALAGEIAAERGEFDKAIALLHEGVLLEDALNYIEPPDWNYPVRQQLGAVLLEAGRPLQAEVVYWDDLRKNPENGWSLFGLAQSLRAQGKDEMAKPIEARFKKAWAKADSRAGCIPVLRAPARFTVAPLPGSP